MPSSLFLYALMQLFILNIGVFIKALAGQTENDFECGFVEHGLNSVLNIWPFPSFSSFLLTSVDQNLKLILVTKYFYNHIITESTVTLYSTCNATCYSNYY